MFYHKFFVLPIIIAWLIPALSVFAVEKETIGWIEKVKINKGRLQLKAKIDTGATTSSINAKILKKFKKNNERWIRFKILNQKGRSIVLERKIIRTVKIKRKLALPIKRYVINIGICIGDFYKEEEINLANRENFVYPVLVGRNYLRGHFLVDSERTLTTKPVCKNWLEYNKG